jgi:hypothetical protein
MKGHAWVVAMGLLAASGPSSAGDVPGAALQGHSLYAEGVYADYSAASSKGVRFELRTVEAGALKALAGLNLQDVVGLPTYHLDADDGPVTVSRVRFSPLDVDRVNMAEFSSLVDDFETVGLALAEGSYRKLEVTAAIGKEARRHQAIEFCWPARGHCVVVDPNMEFLDSIVNGQRQRRAEGWAPVETYGGDAEVPAAENGDVAPAAPRCGLASDPRVLTRRIWRPEARLPYKNKLGQTLFTKILGAQEAGLRCSSTCRALPFGSSLASSTRVEGIGHLYSVDCGNQFAVWSNGGTAVSVAETKCAHRLTFSARADVSIAGAGSASLHLDWDTQGSVDGQGGRLADSCGLF